MKKYLFLLIVPIILFFPKDVFAQTQVMVPDDIRFFQDENLLVTREPQAQNHNGWDLQGTGISSAINKVNYRYSSLGNLKHNTSYDLNFIIRQPNISVASVNSFNGGIPLVLVNDTVCNVTYSSSSQSNSTTFAPFFGVNCSNVLFDETRGMHINVLTPMLSYEAGIYSNFYGISTFIGYNQTQHSQEITESMDKNTETQKETNEKLDKIEESLNDDDTTSSQTQANDFFNNFEDNHHGLSSVITAPLVFIRNLLNHSCTPLHLELPFVDTAVNLPCMKSIYQEHFGIFFNLYQTITTGVIAYCVLIRIFATIKGLQDPQNDKIEVFNL